MDDPPSPREKRGLTPESFDRLLSWLHHDREQAGLKYEEIRTALIRRFRKLPKCNDPEDCTNKTFDRVAETLPKVIETYKGKPEPYFFSVGFNIYREHLRRPIIMSLATLDLESPAKNSEDMSERELLDSCLKHCLDQLDQDSRDMILEYYRGDRQVKIAARKALADRLGINLPSLRLRAQRVRSALKKCVLHCMERKALERHL